MQTLLIIRQYKKIVLKSSFINQAQYFLLLELSMQEGFLILIVILLKRCLLLAQVEGMSQLNRRISNWR